MCTSHLKWRDDPAFLLEENDKPSVVGREAALVLCSEKKQLMNHKILPSLGAVPFFFCEICYASKKKKKKRNEKKKYIGVPRGSLRLESIKGRDPFVCAPHSHSSARRGNIFFAFSSWLARLTSLKRKDCLLSKFFTIILSLTNFRITIFFFFTCTDWHKQDLFLSALAKLPRDPADQSNGLYWNDPLNC